MGRTNPKKPYTILYPKASAKMNGKLIITNKIKNLLVKGNRIKIASMITIIICMSMILVNT